MNEIHYPDRAPPCAVCRHFAVRMSDALPYKCLLWEIECRQGHYSSLKKTSNTEKHCPYFLRRRYHPASGKKGKPSASKPAKEGDVDLTV